MSGLKLSATARTWQTEALARWLPQMRGTISVVTGAGKTYLALMCLVEFYKRYPLGRTIIVVPTTALLDQWHVALQDYLHVAEDQIATFSGEEKSRSPRMINLVIVNTARSVARELSTGHDTFLIVDECHRVGSPINALALSGLHKATLGLSATPIREYDDAFQMTVAPVLGPIIYEYGYQEAREDGIITPFDLINIRIDLLPDEDVKYRSLTRRIARELKRIRGTESNEETLTRLLRMRASLAASAAMRVPVAAKLVETNRGKRTLVFHERVNQANAIASVLAQRNHSVALYHTGIPPSIRRDNLRQYRRGVFDVLVTCRALDEGLNVPETSIAIVASATASYRQRIQRLGRILRPARGKSSATILTIYATDSEEKRLLREAKSVEGVATVEWRHGVRLKDG